MRILVTNDDGVDSPGLIALAEALSAIGDVTVVAPDADQSGVSHAISARRPVSVTKLEARALATYACSGTPADCVILGAYDLCDESPALVVSGINRGANLADDINYSGTVAAAIEAQLLGIPSVAVSLAASWPRLSDEHHWDVAADAALHAARTIIETPLAVDTFLNVNAPNIPRDDVRGTRYTRQGRKRYADRLRRDDDDHGMRYIYTWGTVDMGLDDDESDLVAVAAGYVSVTPLLINRTDEAVLERFRSLSSR